MGYVAAFDVSCTIFVLAEKWLDAASRVDMGHTLGPKCHMSKFKFD